MASRRGGRGSQFERALVPQYTAHGAIGYASRKRRALPWQELLLLCALVALVALAYVLLTAESAATPALSILSPASDATIAAGAVTVSVRVDNANRLIAEQGAHLHYYLDVEPPTTPGRPALTPSSSCFSTAEASHTWRLTASGRHRLSVQLVRANDTPLSPAVVATVSIRVPASASAAAGAPAAPAPKPSASGC
jgi:hypothetical protein